MAEMVWAAILFAALAWACSPLQVDSYTTEPLLDPAGVLQVYPWVYFNHDQIFRGHLPLWNHLTGLGQPHLANIQTAIFYPLYWAWYAIGGENAYGWLMIARLWLAALLWFLFARVRTASFAGALVTGAAYGMGGYALWFAQLIDLNSQLLLPALLLSWSSLWARPRVRMLALSAALVALVIFGGHPEAAFITLFVGLAYTLTIAAAGKGSSAGVRPMAVTYTGGGTDLARAAGPGAIRSAGAIIASLALGGMLSLGVTVPFLNYLSRCWTMHGSGFGFIHLDPRGFFNLIVPGVHQFFKGMPTELPVSMTTAGMWDAFRASYSATAAPGNLPGAGLVVMGLALVALARPRRLNRHALFFIGLLAFTLGLTFGLPLFRLAAFIPPFNMNSNFKFFFSEIHAALAVLAGVGFDAVFRYRAEARHGKILAALAVLVVVLGIYAWLDFTFARHMSETLALQVKIIKWSGMSVFFLALGFAAWRLERMNFRLAGIMIFFISLFVSLGDIHPFISLRPEDQIQPEVSKAVQRLLPPGQRMEGLNGFCPANRPLIDGFADIRSSDALFYRPYVNLINRINHLTPEQSLSYFYPSYYTQVSAEHLLDDDARQLGVSVVIGDELFLPDSIVEQLIFFGSSTYKISPPVRVTRKSGPGLMLHAPASLDYAPRNERGALSFLPSPGYGDGADFMVLSGGPSRSLLYARFIRNCECSFEGKSTDPGVMDLPIVILPGSGPLKLATLPGPRNDSDHDQSAFARVSWHKETFRQPPEPDSNFEDRIFAYRIDSLPWSHLDGDTAALSVTRTAGDAVAVEVPAGKGGAIVIHEVWYPGWTAEVEGKPVAIEIPADKVSWRVKLPAGSGSAAGAGRVVFRFVPWDFRIGLGGVLATALVCLFAVLFQRRGAEARRRKESRK